MQVLMALADSSGRVVSREELLSGRVARRGRRRRGADADHHQAAQGARRQSALAVVHRDDFKARLPLDRAGACHRPSGLRAARAIERTRCRRRFPRARAAASPGLRLVAAVLLAFAVAARLFTFIRSSQPTWAPTRRRSPKSANGAAHRHRRAVRVAGARSRSGLSGARHQQRSDDRSVASARLASDQITERRSAKLHAVPDIWLRAAFSAMPERCGSTST